VVYGSSIDNRAGQATVSFDGNGDGTYETVLGTETLATTSTSATDVYPINDHVNKQNLDYMLWYDVTSLVNANTVNAQILTENIGGSTFDGRLKDLTLVIAYNDGDSDQVKYWVNEGHDAQTSSGSAVTTTFGTSTLTSGWTEATLTNIHHSSRDSTYAFNGNMVTGANPVAPYASFVKNVWDVKTSLTAGSNSNFVYTHAASSSFKTTLAALKVRYATPPTAQFSATPVNGIAPLNVQFTDQSLLATSWAWDFNNDGVVDSTVQSPSYTYTTDGTYTVKLTATGAGGSDEEIKTSYITVNGAPSISVSPASQSFLPATTREYQIVIDGVPNGLAGYDLKVHLTNPQVAEITNVVYPSWAGMSIVPNLPSDMIKIGAADINNQVNGGATNVLLATITVRGDSVGTTPIQLQAIHLDADGGHPIVPKIVNGGEAIIGSYNGPVAQFSATPTSGLAPVAVTFTDASTGTITSWAWDFNNDGTIDSTSQNPSYTYTAIGVYTVKLTVTGPGGSNSLVKTNYIAATSNAPVAQFSATPTSGNYPLTVAFTDASAGTVTSYAWDFNNDGTPESILKNPTYTFTIPGTYTVKHIVTGPGGSDDETKTDYITVTVNGPVADFSGYPTEGIAPLNVQFQDQSTGTITSWAWDLNNDGTIDSTQQNPSLYNYPSAGLYSVKLTVTGPGGSNTKVKTNYITASGLTADFTANQTSGVASRNVSFAVQFSDASTGSPLGATAWQWTLGNGASSTETNPSAQYTGRPHQFTVTLDASNDVDHASRTKTNYISITPYLEKFPTYDNLPTDMNGDYVYEDINGNGRIDYDDVVAWYNNMAWMKMNNNVDVENYDFNFNGRIDFDDAVVLYNMIIYS
jgi:PKD repeat protein